MSSVTILVRDFDDEYAITIEPGRAIAARVLTSIRAGNSVVVDFSGVKLAAAPFLNGMLSSIAKYYTVEELSQRVTFINVPDGVDVLHVYKNAYLYWHDAEYRTAINEIVNELYND